MQLALKRLRCAPIEAILQAKNNKKKLNQWLNQTIAEFHIFIISTSLLQQLFHIYSVSKFHALTFALQTYGSLQDVLVSFGRRVLCYPLYRHIDMVSAAIRDTAKILQSGELPRNATQPTSTFTYTIAIYTACVKGGNAGPLLLHAALYEKKKATPRSKFHLSVGRKGSNRVESRHNNGETYCYTG